MTETIVRALEKFVRTQFNVPTDDAGFARNSPLFELGYIDSLGYVELIAFIGEEFGVELPDDALISDDFSTLEGIASLVVMHGTEGDALIQQINAA